MKHLFYILAVIFLASCTNSDIDPSPMSPKSGGAFSFGGDSILSGDYYDTIDVSGLSTPYSCRQLAKIEVDLVHPHLEELAIYLFNPDGATYIITDWGADNELTGSNISNMTIVNGATCKPTMWSSSAPYSGVFVDSGTYTNTIDETFTEIPLSTNGDWVIYIHNEGADHGYLNEFKLTFNY